MGYEMTPPANEDKTPVLAMYYTENQSIRLVDPQGLAISSNVLADPFSGSLTFPSGPRRREIENALKTGDTIVVTAKELAVMIYSKPLVASRPMQKAFEIFVPKARDLVNDAAREMGFNNVPSPPQPLADVLAAHIIAPTKPAARPQLRLVPKPDKLN
jgi:hypothetical protein